MHGQLTCASKHGVEDVGDVVRSIGNATFVRILCARPTVMFGQFCATAEVVLVGTYLCREDKVLELVCVDPVQPADDAEGGQHPPAVADVFELLRSPVEAAIGQLSLGEPRADAVAVDLVQSLQDG